MNAPTIHTDEFGFLVERHTWNERVAQELASRESIELTAAHWDIICAAHTFYDEYDLSPSMRPFIKHLKQTLNPDINSVYLLSLFPGSPAKIVSKIAGLPKPENCL
ncbi:MAG: TusE/DsrC/DsvC family sulfur relay protein [Pseudomonadota bacterium]